MPNTENGREIIQGSLTVDGDLVVTEEAIIKTYSQAAEPTLAADEQFCFWKDTDDSFNA